MVGVDVNLVYLIVAAIVYFVLGALWYSPVMFGNIWRTGMSMSPDETDGSPPVSLVLTFVSSLLMAYFLGALLGALGIVAMAGAVVNALLVWLGFAATTSFTSAAFDTRPWSVFLVNTGYHLAGLLLMAIVYVLVAV